MTAASRWRWTPTNHAFAVDSAEEVVGVDRRSVRGEERGAELGQRLLAWACDLRPQCPRGPGFLLEGRCPRASSRQDLLEQAGLGALGSERWKARPQARRQELEDPFRLR